MGKLNIQDLFMQVVVLYPFMAFKLGIIWADGRSDAHEIAARAGI